MDAQVPSLWRGSGDGLGLVHGQDERVKADGVGIGDGEGVELGGAEALDVKAIVFGGVMDGVTGQGLRGALAEED